MSATFVYGSDRKIHYAVNGRNASEGAFKEAVKNIIKDPSKNIVISEGRHSIVATESELNRALAKAKFKRTFGLK